MNNFRLIFIVKGSSYKESLTWAKEIATQWHRGPHGLLKELRRINSLYSLLIGTDGGIHLNWICAYVTIWFRNDNPEG